MEELTIIAFSLGVIAYSAATTLFLVELARRDALKGAHRWAPRLLGAAVVFHAAHIVLASFLLRVCPVESVHFALSLTALIAATIYLFLRRRSNLHAIGAFVAPAALTFLVAAQFVGAGPTLGPDVPRTLLAVHVTANLLGVGLFLLAGVAGAFYVVQERQLKEKRATWLAAKMPPLDALDSTEHHLLLAGFPLLTIGVASGAVFAGELSRLGGAELIRVALAYGTWVLAGVVLVLRRVAGWRGRRAAYGSIAGAVCVLLVIGLYVVQPGIGVPE